ncbi:PUA domain containing protein [Pyrolobus fumarii 1A]|uniref:PUA domain containing protein n=1 Tax=Pyrolobus fumarii (strain DSM 11204 / 1A) TaxID=694429 RepID=G0EEX4_PYRF1|nr:DUF1947 domain-containing protein [Pyrolobus fumarii]AEM38088.1 PUA domain containing protein [Pyrolobus fumarii 1A]
MRRWKLSKRDRRKLLEEIKSRWPEVPLSSEPDVEVISDKKEGIEELYIIDGKPAFARIENKLIPLISYLLDVGVDWLPRIIVDEGAVRPLTRGANLMRPGIVSVEGEFNRGDIVVILEPVKRIPIAVHEALVDSSEVANMERGVVSKRLHYMGDRLWKYARSV